MYTYKDFETGKLRKTRGEFAGWTPPMGLLRVRYAIFRNRYGDVLVPDYCLTPETRSTVMDIEIARAFADERRQQDTARLPAIVAQLEACDYTCIAGPLENNTAFVELKRIAAEGAEQ